MLTVIGLYILSQNNKMYLQVLWLYHEYLIAEHEVLLDVVCIYDGNIFFLMGNILHAEWFIQNQMETPNINYIFQNSRRCCEIHNELKFIPWLEQSTILNINPCSKHQITNYSSIQYIIFGHLFNNIIIFLVLLFLFVLSN